MVTNPFTWKYFAHKQMEIMYNIYSYTSEYKKPIALYKNSII